MLHNFSLSYFFCPTNSNVWNLVYWHFDKTTTEAFLSHLPSRWCNWWTVQFVVYYFKRHFGMQLKTHFFKKKQKHSMKCLSHLFQILCLLSLTWELLFQEASDLFENEDPGDINFFFHPIFKNFMDLSRAAFIRANKCDIKDTQQFNKFFNFAVELQWRIALFCWGPRKANAKFVFDIKFDSPTARHRQIVKPKRFWLLFQINVLSFRMIWHFVFVFFPSSLKEGWHQNIANWGRTV